MSSSPALPGADTAPAAPRQHHRWPMAVDWPRIIPLTAAQVDEVAAEAVVPDVDIDDLDDVA